MQKASKFDLKFIKKEQVSKDAFSFYFQKPSSFNFIPGQYIKLYLEIENSDERGSSRYFTISSSPTDDFLTVTTRIIKSSFKIKLNSLVPGDMINVFGPVGYFDYDPKLNSPAVFIAGGIGATPFHSLIRFLDSKNLKPRITLFNSFSHKDESVFFDEFKAIEKKDPNIKIIYSLTKEDLEGFESGRINAEMIKKHVPDFLNNYFFIVGPLEMVESMFDIVLQLGISEEKIFKEDFTGY